MHWNTFDLIKDFKSVYIITAKFVAQCTNINFNWKWKIVHGGDAINEIVYCIVHILNVLRNISWICCNKN